RGSVRTFVMVAVLMGLAVVGSLLGEGIVTLLGRLPPGRALTGLWISLRTSVVMPLVFGTSLVIYETMRSRLEATTLELRTQELERERAQKLATEARLASLESRLQPHFLFNTLNSISALIQEDPARAERLVERLAALLRFALAATRRSPGPLGEELRRATAHPELARARLGDRLRYAIDVPAGLEAALVPPLALQTLVENSVKHVAAPRRAGATIRVEARPVEGGLALAVWDDGPRVRLDAAAARHGADNHRGGPAGPGLDTRGGGVAALLGPAAGVGAALGEGGGVVPVALRGGRGRRAGRRCPAGPAPISWTTSRWRSSGSPACSTPPAASAS